MDRRENPFLIRRNRVRDAGGVRVLVEQLFDVGISRRDDEATSVPPMPGGGDLVSDSILKVPLELVCASNDPPSRQK